MGSRYSEDRDIGCHTTQNCPEAFQCKTGSGADTSPVGDLSPVGRNTGYTPLFGWRKERHTHLVGRG
jgi:hypothetical protein